MATIELRNLVKRYGTVQAIHGLDLDIEDGEFTVLVGPSGCGKSTLLRMIAGLEDITGGELLIGGRNANGLEPLQRGVAMVFQNYALYPHMNVENNIGFSLRIAGVPRKEITARVRAVCETLQIGHLLDRKPANLSGGQRQRVAIGRAIIRNPEVFLFDEPLSNLDAELRVSMRVEIARLHQRLGATMIYVTHDQTEAMTMADKIVVLREGRIEQQGTSKKLYSDPDNIFVAGFIGSPRMNFIEGCVRGGALKLGDAIELPCPVSAGDGEYQVGIRPEHFLPGDANGVPAPIEVDVTEYLGGTCYVYGGLNGGETPLVIEARDREDLKPGEKTIFRIDPGKIYMFDTGGQRVR